MSSIDKNSKWASNQKTWPSICFKTCSGEFQTLDTALKISVECLKDTAASIGQRTH